MKRGENLKNMTIRVRLTGRNQPNIVLGRE